MNIAKTSSWIGREDSLGASSWLLNEFRFSSVQISNTVSHCLLFLQDQFSVSRVPLGLS